VAAFLFFAIATFAIIKTIRNIVDARKMREIKRRKEEEKRVGKRVSK
jgi:hypothetical protein